MNKIAGLERIDPGYWTPIARLPLRPIRTDAELYRLRVGSAMAEKAYSRSFC